MEQRAAQKAGGRASWGLREKALARARAESPLGRLLETLEAAVDELRQPGLPPDEVGRLRGLVYAVSVAGKLLETREIDAEVRELKQRLDEGVRDGKPS